MTLEPNMRVRVKPRQGALTKLHGGEAKVVRAVSEDVVMVVFLATQRTHLVSTNDLVVHREKTR